MTRELIVRHECASTFRHIINARLRGSEESIRELLALNKNTDGTFLTAGMDIVEDACEAIGNAQQFGLAGPTKYNDQGEKYLRLYGLLSAAYIQQRAVLTIYKLMNVPNLKDAKEQCAQLSLVILRHKLSAHGTDYQDDGELHAYVSVRVSLGEMSVTAARHAMPFQQEEVDLALGIHAHSMLMIALMDAVCEKTIGTVLKGDQSKKKEFTGRLAELRVKKEGGWVWKGPEGAPKFIIVG